MLHIVISVAILAPSALGQSACPESLFGYVDPARTTIIDSTISPKLLADTGFFQLIGGGNLMFSTVAHLLHYVPGLDYLYSPLFEIPFTGLGDWESAADQRRKFFSIPGPPQTIFGGIDNTCILPGPPQGHCSKYVKTVYKEGCPFFKEDAVLVGGAIANPSAGVNAAGFFAGCEIESIEEYCYSRDESGWGSGMNAVKCECSKSACPETLFGYVDPDLTTIVDSSVPPLIYADDFGWGKDPKAKFLYSASVVNMMHYAPGLSNVPGAEDARKMFNSELMPGLTKEGCIMPGPAPGHCGRYVKTVYKKGCPFFAPGATLALGALPDPSSGVNDTGFFANCEIEHVSEYYYAANYLDGDLATCDYYGVAQKSTDGVAQKSTDRQILFA